ncbi:MAG: FGGY family carbohydrate kinase [Ignavibacteriota bacterium]
MVDGLGLDRTTLPKCYESSEVTGKITPRVAELTGLAAGTPVVGGGRRSGGECCRQRHRRAWYRIVHAGDIGRGVRAHGQSRVRPRRPRPYLLPRGPR